MHPALMMRIQDTGHSLVWYLTPSNIPYTAIDDKEDRVFLFVEHQITFHFLIQFTRLSLTLSRPVFKTSLILGSFAWNQPRVLRTTLGSRLRKFRGLICTSNHDQSGGRGRAPGFPAGGGGGASPPRRRP
eukprot:4038823-Pyramimonas_sp.AAC.1